MLKQLLFCVACVLCYHVNAQIPNLEWAKSMGNNNQLGADSYGHSVVVDSDGNVYTYGKFADPVDFDPGPGVSILSTTATFIQKLDPDGNFIWAKELPVWSGHTDKCLAIDAQNNLYMTGGFEGTVDVDPGAGVFNLTPVDQMDVFILKLDSDGNFIWAKSFGGTAWDRGASIAVDANQNVYTCGFYTYVVDFDPGPGVFDLTETNNGKFVQKLDASGNFLWATSLPVHVAGYYGYSIAVDDIGSVYSTGHFSLTTDFDPGVGTYNLTAVDGRDIFIQKLDANGNFVWTKTMGGNSIDIGLSITVDANRNIYTTGYFYDAADFDPGPGVFNLISVNPAGYDVYIQKLDEFGDFMWAKNFGDIYLNFGQSIAVDDQGSVYTTGLFSDTIDFDPGPGVFNLISLSYNGDIFIQKLDESGDFVWAVSAPGDTLPDASFDIAVDPCGNVYTTGYFENTVDFDPGAGVLNLSTPPGTSHIFVQKLSQHEQPLATLGNDTTLCENEALILDATSVGATYLWQDGSTDSIYQPTATGTYWVEVNVNGCRSIDTIHVLYELPPTVDIGNDTTLCEGEVLILNASSPGLSYLWQDNSTDSTFVASQAGNYNVMVSNTCGTDSDELSIEFLDCGCPFYVPNSFTPNGDFVNDEFSSVFNCDFSEFNMRIFNRWGQLIFETNSPNQSWDGKYKGTLSPIGVYVYQVNYTFENEFKTKYGTVSLVR
jgi:gliding motility-associated-like protein